MEKLIIALVVVISSQAVAQSHRSINRSINDDGKTLSIRVSGTVDGNPIDYDHTFDVASLNKDERRALRERILDSLNVSMPEPPQPPVAPRASVNSLPPVAPMPPARPESIEIRNSDQSIISVTSDDNQALVVGGKQPFTKEVRYDSKSGQLSLRYRFRKDGDDVTYERTIDAQDKSQQQRQRIIGEIEKAIGVPTTGK